MSAPARAALGAEAGYALLRRGGPAAAARRRALVWVEGADAAHFLHGLLSNDVAALAPGRACRALLLDAKGHLRAELAVHRDDQEAFTLAVEPALGEAVVETLEHYHFSERLELLGPEPAETLVALGAPADIGEVAELVLPGPLPGSLELVVTDPGAALARLGLPEAPSEALEMARIAAGVAVVGVDTGPTSLVQEAGLETTAVSFDKGCYLGQETVARAQYRGKVNRRLRGLALADPPPPAGAPVTLAGREVGSLTSLARTPDLGPIGLAILRREAEPGAAVEVAGTPATVVALPFPESPGGPESRP